MDMISINKIKNIRYSPFSNLASETKIGGGKESYSNLIPSGHQWNR